MFKKLYRVKAPRALTLTEEEIERYGQRVTGIKKLDAYLANEMITGRVPVTEMARIINEGGQIQFLNKEDVKTIYLDLHQHFVNWEFILGTDFNATPPPPEDFEVLRKFQLALDIFAGYFDREDPNRNPLADFTTMSARNQNRKFKPQRIHINGLKPMSREEVPVDIIRSYEDLQNIDRSR